VMSVLRNIEFPPRKIAQRLHSNAAAGQKVPSQSHEVPLLMS
jgi:hypothetical protein